MFVVWKVIKGDDGLFLVGGGRRNQGRVCKGDCSWGLEMGVDFDRNSFNGEYIYMYIGRERKLSL